MFKSMSKSVSILGILGMPEGLGGGFGGGL